MRVIATKTLKFYSEKYYQANQALFSCYEEVATANWSNHNELKEHYRNASVLNNKLVVFNIHGNSYRLIVDIEYRVKIVIIVWFGTHKEYDQVDAKTVSYVKIN